MPLSTISNLKNPLYYYMLKSHAASQIPTNFKYGRDSIYAYPVLLENTISLEFGFCVIKSSHIRVPEAYNRLNYYNVYHDTLHIVINGIIEKNYIIHIYEPNRATGKVVRMRDSENIEIEISKADEEMLIEFSKTKIEQVLEPYCTGLQNEIDALFEDQEYILGFENPDNVEDTLEKANDWLARYNKVSAMGVINKNLKLKRIKAIVSMHTSTDPIAVLSTSHTEPTVVVPRAVEVAENQDSALSYSIQFPLFTPDTLTVETQNIQQFLFALDRLKAYYERTKINAPLTHEEAIEYHDTARLASFLSFNLTLGIEQETEIQGYIEDSTRQCTKLMEKIWYATDRDFCCLRTGADQRPLLDELSLRSDMLLEGAISRNDPLKAFILMRSPKKIDWLMKYCGYFDFDQDAIKNYMLLAIHDKQSENDGYECFIALLRNGLELKNFYEMLIPLRSIFTEKIGEEKAREKLLPIFTELEKCKEVHDRFQKRYNFTNRIARFGQEWARLDKHAANYQTECIRIYRDLHAVKLDQYKMKRFLIKNLTKAFPDNVKSADQSLGLREPMRLGNI